VVVVVQEPATRRWQVRTTTFCKGVLVSTGIYGLLVAGCARAPGPGSEQAKQVEALVDEAAALIEAKGDAAFDEFRTKESEWYRGETYIFVDDMHGTALVNPASPGLEGTNILDMKDLNGKAFVREMIQMLEGKESGWIEYMWPKPGETEPSNKMSYVKRVQLGDRTLIVGSGIYSD
jgi:cytochrome c